MADAGISRDMEILELDSFEVPFPMSVEERERYSRRFLTLFMEPGSQPHRGGSGCVFKVMNAEGETFAMKRIEKPPRPVTMDDERYERMLTAQVAAFRKEFENQQRLSGLKGFPKLFGYGMEHGEPLIVMEWVEGMTCSRAADLRSADPTGRRAAPLVVARLGIALFDLISRFNYLDDSFAHRDISPSNIMLRTNRLSVADQVASDDYDICLIDFGSATLLASHDDPSFTTSMNVLRKATPEYAPPEMLTDDLPDLERLRRSALIDVYAIASVLYELMSGHTPYRLGELSCDPQSYYRYKLDHQIPLPLSLHADPKALGRLSAQPRLLEITRRMQASGDLDEKRLVEAVGVVDSQLGQILLRALTPMQAGRAQAWEMKDMLTRFVESYAKNIERCYRGLSLIPFVSADTTVAPATAVIPLGAQVAPVQATVLRPVMPMVTYIPTPRPAMSVGVSGGVRTVGRNRTHDPDRAAILASGIVTGLLVLVIAVLFSIALAGSPGTLRLFGGTYTVTVSFLVFFLMAVAPPLIALPFFWVGTTPGSKLLWGTSMLIVLEGCVWFLVRSTSWVSASVEPFACFGMACIICITVIAGWRLTARCSSRR